MSNVLEAVRVSGAPIEKQVAPGQTSLQEWASFWAGGSEPPAGFHILQNLPQSLQKRIAAEFELLPRKALILHGGQPKIGKMFKARPERRRRS
jgi:hypothetical protein